MTHFLQRLRQHERLRRYLGFFSLRLLAGFGLSLLCLWLFAAIADEINEDEWLVRFDQALTDELYASATPQRTDTFIFITLFGGEIMRGIAVVVALYYLWRRHWLHLTLWLIALGGGEVLNLLLKTLFARARPEFSDPLTMAGYYSFPSGHAMFSMIGYGMLAYLIMKRITNVRARIFTGFLAALIILLVGISRLYLGVHFFSDVVGGFAAGGIWLITCIGALNFLDQRFNSSANDRATER